MCFKQISQIIEFLANIVTVLGFFSGGGCLFLYKYNRRSITYINRETTIKVNLPIKDIMAIAYSAKEYDKIAYSQKKVGKNN